MLDLPYTLLESPIDLRPRLGWWEGPSGYQIPMSDQELDEIGNTRRQAYEADLAMIEEARAVQP